MALVTMVLHYEYYIPDTDSTALTESLIADAKNDDLCTLARDLTTNVIERYSLDNQNYLFAGPGGWMDPGPDIDIHELVSKFSGTEIRPTPPQPPPIRRHRYPVSRRRTTQGS